MQQYKRMWTMWADLAPLVCIVAVCVSNVMVFLCVYFELFYERANCMCVFFVAEGPSINHHIRPEKRWCKNRRDNDKVSTRNLVRTYTFIHQQCNTTTFQKAKVFKITFYFTKLLIWLIRSAKLFYWYLDFMMNFFDYFSTMYMCSGRTKAFFALLL